VLGGLPPCCEVVSRPQRGSGVLDCELAELPSILPGATHTKPVKAKYLRVTIPTANEDMRLTIEVLRCEPIGRFWDVGGRVGQPR